MYTALDQAGEGIARASAAAVPHLLLNGVRRGSRCGTGLARRWEARTGKSMASRRGTAHSTGTTAKQVVSGDAFRSE